MNKENHQPNFLDTEVAYAHLSNKKLQRAARIYRLLSNAFFVKLGTQLVKIASAIRFPIKPFVKSSFYDQFCGGENLQATIATINLLQQRNVNVDLNYSVETKHAEADFDKTFFKLKGAIEFASRKNSVKVLCCKVTGLGKHALIEKLQKYQQLSSNEQEEFKRMNKRMDDLCALAKEHGVKIYFDAEESWVQTEIDKILDALMKKYNTERAVVYNTFQLYRVDKLTYLEQKIAEAKAEGYFLGVKLVRGAYVEKENKWAQKNGVPSIIHSNKAAVDKDFDASLSLCIDNLDFLAVCIASHNEESNILATKLLAEKNIIKNHPNIDFAQLYGMGDFITFNMAKAGYNATKYLPYGPVREVIPYLIRRAEENTSVDGQTTRELEMLQLETKRRNK